MSERIKMQNNKTWLKEQIDNQEVVYCRSCDVETKLLEHFQKYYAKKQGKILCNSCVTKLHDSNIEKYTN